jgi:hypothetical protein
MKRLLPPLLAFLVCASPVARASDGTCTEGVYGAVGRYLKVKNFLPNRDGGPIVADACKTWPHDSARVLAVLAYDNGREDAVSMVVAMLDTKTQRVIASYRTVIEEDAAFKVGESSLKLDTARYRLSPDHWAFGVRFTSSARGPSCADAARWDELTLFIQERGALRPVFRREMQFQNALQGCIGTGTGRDVWEYGKQTIAVADTSTNGFADLQVMETITVEGNLDPLPKGIDTKKKTRSYLLKYDGREYR